MPRGLRDRLAEPLRVFTRDHVTSFEQLRALLCVARGAGRPWSPAEVAAAIGLPVELVAGALAELAEAGRLVVASPSGGGYVFAPESGASRDLVEDLARVYDAQPLAIIRMMNENALERLRSTAARRLAEAFRLDREKK